MELYNETADILPDPNFESGVTKIQMGLNASMTNDEKIACSKLLNNVVGSFEEEDEEGGNMSFQERMERFKSS